MGPCVVHADRNDHRPQAQRKIPFEYAQITGMVILVALMLYANGNDWFGWEEGSRWIDLLMR